MNGIVLNDPQWMELSAAVALFDQNGNRTILDQALISMMQNIVETLDDDYQPEEENDSEHQLIMTEIETEIAGILARNDPARWCCRGRQVHPTDHNCHRLADYLTNLARGKLLDKNGHGFISMGELRTIVGARMTEAKMAELLQYVNIDDDGRIDYNEFATMMMIAT